MYCSGCGKKLDAHLNYCNACGARVGRDEKSAVGDNLSSALGYIGGFGLLGFIFAVYLMMRSATTPPGTIVAVSFLYLATLFGICFLILRQTAPFTMGRKDQRGETDRFSSPDREALRPITTAQLGESTQEPISVTEHTTRALDETPLKR